MPQWMQTAPTVEGVVGTRVAESDAVAVESPVRVGAIEPVPRYVVDELAAEHPPSMREHASCPDDGVAVEIQCAVDLNAREGGRGEGSRSRNSS